MKPSIKDIYHTELIEECKLNLDKSAYGKNGMLKKDFYHWRKIDRRNNQSFWPKIIIEDKQCFTFLGYGSLQKILLAVLLSI